MVVRQDTVEIYSDASGFGYGSTWNGIEVQGLFTECQKSLSINTKELLAIYYALGTHANKLAGEVVMVRCDNTTAISCIRNCGSSDFLRDKITVCIFELAFKHNFEIRISYVQSAENLSNRVSSKFDSIHAEWSISDRDFKSVIELAKTPPEIDLFAHAQNKRLEKFVSWKPCIGATHVDAFTLNWKNLRAFLFPPFPCISSVIKKCLDDRVTMACGIFPLWKTKSWWPGLMRLANHEFTVLHGANKRLRLPWSSTERHPMMSRLKLIFVNLSVNYCNAKSSPLTRLTIARNVWREGTLKEKKGMVKYWESYTSEAKKGFFDLTFDTLMGFLDFVRTKSQKFSVVRRARDFVVVMKKIVGEQLSPAQRFLVDKYMAAALNTNPPHIRRQSSTWDVNILLDYLVKLGPNSKIEKINILAGKLVLQLLLTQMCRSGEVAQLQLSSMRLLQGAVQFQLMKPTKTYSVQNASAAKRLQLMTIKEFEANPLLCPLTTLLSYIECTKFRRGNVDNLFVLVTTQQPRAASRETVVRWGKEIMKLAGLGTFKIHSSHAASSTSALLMGMPLDHIIAKVGWVKASTFIKYYMKPIRSTQRAEVNSDKVRNSKKSKNHHCFKDPHDYTDFWVQHTPKLKVCNGAADQVSTFKNMHGTGSPVQGQGQVYGPTPLSPASTIGYSYPDNFSIEQQQVASSTHQDNDPFDFDSELALIQDCELTDECTRSLVESLKETQLELVSRGLSPPVAFSDRAPSERSSPIRLDEMSSLDTASEEPSLSSSLHEAYNTLNDLQEVIGEDLLVVDHITNVPLSPGNT